MSRPNQQTLDAAWHLIDEARSVVIVMHLNPDGDALGSAIALTLALKEMGKQVYLLCNQTTPEIYDFLQPRMLLEAQENPLSPDLVILIDCDRPDRTGDLEKIVKETPKALVIDHHPPTSDFGTIRLIDSDSAAAAQVVYYLLEHRAVSISEKMAEALLTGIITDTGGFRFRNTQAETLQIAASLTAIGPSIAEIAEKVYDTRTFAGLKLMARALESMKTSPGGHVVWATLSAKDYEETGARPEDTEGFVNLVHGLRGADVAAILREEKPGTVRVSLRSRGVAYVNRAAEALGGGGHELAAACVVESSLKEAEIKVLDELKKWTEF